MTVQSAVKSVATRRGDCLSLNRSGLGLEIYPNAKHVRKLGICCTCGEWESCSLSNIALSMHFFY